MSYYLHLLRVYIEALELYSQSSRLFNPLHCKAYNISIDFYKLPLDRNGYNIVIILVNHFSKRLFLILYYKNINIKETA